MAEDNAIEVRGLDPIIEKMRYFPQKFKQMQKLGMHASLLVFWENVPPYPAKPADSTYRRTGTLGRSLGSSVRGGKGGSKPEIYKIQRLGTSRAEGKFGTRLQYAPFVIGDQQARQNRHWWKLTVVLKKSEKKIIDIWERIMDKMAKWLERPSSGAR